MLVYLLVFCLENIKKPICWILPLSASGRKSVQFWHAEPFEFVFSVNTQQRRAVVVVVVRSMLLSAVVVCVVAVAVTVAAPAAAGCFVLLSLIIQECHKCCSLPGRERERRREEKGHTVKRGRGVSIRLFCNLSIHQFDNRLCAACAPQSVADAIGGPC